MDRSTFSGDSVTNHEQDIRSEKQTVTDELQLHPLALLAYSDESANLPTADRMVLVSKVHVDRPESRST